MKRYGLILITGALVALARSEGRNDDPEPPPPIKVSSVKGSVKVQVKSTAGGPLLVAEGGAGKGTQSCELSFAEKNAPKKITLRVKNVDRLGLFVLMGKTKDKGDRLMIRPGGQGKQSFHFGATGQLLNGEKGARLSFHYIPGKDQVEVEMVRHADASWPKPPFRVYWGQQTFKKKG